jgi:glycine/D-amino acid oxidase-like deaminating enzyme
MSNAGNVARRYVTNLIYSRRCVSENLWVAFADSGKGVTFAPVIGDLMAEQIMSEEANPDLGTYSPGRFLP